MKFSSPYKVDIPNEDVLTHVLLNTKFKDNDTVWIDGEDPELCITLSQARSLIGLIGQSLRNLGVGASDPASDVVLSFVENQILIGPILFGILAAEGIYSTCSRLATPFELARQISLSTPKVLICSAQTKDIAQTVLRNHGSNASPILLEMDSKQLDLRLVSNGNSILSVGQFPLQCVTDPNVLRNRTACLIYSSGTTGTPKGVELSHANIVANLRQMGYHFGPRTDKIRREGNTPRMPALLQNSVAVGVLVHNMLALLHGMQVVMMAKYDFETLTRYNAKYNLSVFFLAPSIWNRIINEWDVEDCKSIRWAMSGGSPLPLVLQNRVNDALTPGTYLLPNWGMTELVCGATQLDPDTSDNEGSVGFLLPHMEAMIVSESGAALPSGQSGELVVKGPNVMRGYYRNPSATLEAFSSSGWFRTGDKATIKSSGKVFIEGRYKELMKYKGNQVSPVELEAIISQHPAVIDVGVTGVQLADGNELPRAYVVPGRDSNNCTEQEIIEWVKGLLSNFKQLRGGVAFVPEIPRNLNGKIMRDILRRWTQENPILGEKRLSKL
ncbi:hypothetical protein LTR84_010259 [Exophiala bonariae]|uniref:Acetyl-CoA synthetase-like protein n=1 Tax=Exophiala bonariae TaxID=1690606 RepID=A0AAV9MTY7_9EURO|nr:hypothetical protein LTR84_010259 [Exophiala bonariae]